MKLLYLTWDGPNQNYLESLFLPILARARRSGDEVHVLQFTRATQSDIDSVTRAAKDFDITYVPRRIRSWPCHMGTGVALVTAIMLTFTYSRTHRIDVLMPRSVLLATVVLGLRRLGFVRATLYDADGLMSMERREFAGWSPNGLKYRLLVLAERFCSREADVIVVRTSTAVRSISTRRLPMPPGRVLMVSNGKDAAEFHPGTPEERESVRQEIGVAGTAPLVVYAGSLARLKYNPDRIMAFFRLTWQRCPDARLLVLTGSPALAETVFRSADLPPGVCDIKKAAPSCMARYVRAADLGLAFIQPSASMKFASPIKVGEYLLCGVPVLTSQGIGDVDSQIDESCSRVLPKMDDSDLEDSVEWFLQSVMPNRETFRCKARSVGLAHFDLERSAQEYAAAFGKVDEVVRGFSK